MNKERVVLILEDLNGKLDLLLEMQEALLKEMRDGRKESNARHDHTASLLQRAIDCKRG